MDLMMTRFTGLSAEQYPKHIGTVDAAGGWPTYVISNHDIVPSYTRYADGAHNDDIAKLMAALYLTLRGTAVMYYGKKIGMKNNRTIIRRVKTKCKTPSTSWAGRWRRGRDGERTPIQWNDGQNAGFRKTKPWLPVPASAKTHNVATEMTDPNSVLSFYRQLLALRRKEPALLEGSYTALNENDPNVLTYLRRYKDDAIVVVLNMSATEQKVPFDLSPRFWCTAA
jgi:alpha-glucosidase